MYINNNKKNIQERILNESFANQHLERTNISPMANIHIPLVILVN